MEGGRVFADPLAVGILGAPPSDLVGEALNEPQVRAMRLFISARSRFAEDSLAAAVARGVRQYVVLGAGLDTFAHRNPFAHLGLRVFEVDDPATQAWKRRRLLEAGLGPAASLTFASVDFERQTLAEGLGEAGFDPDQPAFFSWLGVIVYLTRQTVLDTLGWIARLPGGGEVVFDYGEPISAYPPEQRPVHEARLARMAAIGEPWITRFTRDDLAAALHGVGFTSLEDLSPAEIGRRFYGVTRPDGPGGHVVRAARLDDSR
jgi:methyltransferase (TIGR00027 family)